MNIMESLINDQKTISYREGYEAPGSTYIVKRNKQRIVPLTGSSQYTPNSTRRISWRVPIDPSTGTAPTKYSFQGSHTPFQRLRITCGGVVMEDIQGVNVLEHLVHLTTGNDDLVNCPIGKTQGLNPKAGAVAGSSHTADFDWTTDIGPASNGYEFCWKPRVSGVLSNDKILPLPYCPELVIELYLDDATNVVLTDQGSCSYQVDDVKLNCDTVEFDSEYVSAFEASLNNSPMNWYFTTFSNFQQTVDGTSDVVIGSFRTDLKGVYSVFRENTDIGSQQATSYKFKRNGVSEYQLSLGSMKLPLEPCSCSSAAEQARSLTLYTQCLANIRDNSLGMNIKYEDWAKDTDAYGCWAIGLDMTVADAQLGGLSSTYHSKTKNELYNINII
eukprot:Pgem_evm8s8721